MYEIVDLSAIAIVINDMIISTLSISETPPSGIESYLQDFRSHGSVDLKMLRKRGGHMVCFGQSRNYVILMNCAINTHSTCLSMSGRLYCISTDSQYEGPYEIGTI